MTARWLITGLLVLGMGLTAYGLYIPLKAELAQYLLRDAWQETLQGGKRVHPWASADTWPVARLQQPRLGIDQVVLAGASGRVLAFGPGHVDGSAALGASGNSVLSGHRDTHFAWLASLQAGDELLLDLADGRQLRYAVMRRAIHQKSDQFLLAAWDFDGLRLLTCYPFDDLSPDPEQRYVVDAVLM